MSKTVLTIKPGDEIGGEKCIAAYFYKDCHDDMRFLFIGEDTKRQRFHLFSSTPSKPLFKLQYYHTTRTSANTRVAEIIETETGELPF